MNAIDVFSALSKPATRVALMGVMLLNLICTICWKSYSVQLIYMITIPKNGNEE